MWLQIANPPSPTLFVPWRGTDEADSDSAGHRLIDAISDVGCLPRIGHAILRTTLNGRGRSAIEVGAADGEFAYRFDEEATT